MSRPSYTTVEPFQKLEEPIALRDDGTPIMGEVDTTKFPFRLTCHCGRVRYVGANCVHQVDMCRICTKTRRLRRRAIKQHNGRHDDAQHA